MTDSEPSKQDNSKQKDSKEDYGYFFYPERQGVKKNGFFDKMHEGRKAGQTLKCFNNVSWCIQKSKISFK